MRPPETARENILCIVGLEFFSVFEKTVPNSLYDFKVCVK